MAHRSWFTRYFVSYVCLAMIPVIALSLVVYYTSILTREREARDLFTASLVQVSARLDALQQEMQASAMHLSSVEALRQILDKGGEQALQSMLPSYLTNYENNASLPMRTLFYPRGGKLLYISGEYLPYNTFVDTMLSEATLDRSSFFKYLNQSTVNRSWLLSLSEGRLTSPSDQAAFLFPYPTLDPLPKGSLVFLVDTDDLLQLVERYVGIVPDYLWIYNGDYALIALHEARTLTESQRSLPPRAARSGIAHTNWYDTHYNLISYTSDVYGFQLHLGVTDDQLYGNVLHMRRSMAFMAVLLLAAILVGAVALAWYNYRPVHTLLRSVGGNGRGNEFKQIAARYSDVESSVNRLQELVELQQPMVRDRLMHHLLRGTLTEAHALQLRYAFPEMRFDGRTLFVALVHGGPIAPEASQFLQTALPLEQAQSVGVVLEEERMIALVVALDASGDPRAEIGLRLLEMLRQRGMTQISLGLGQPVSELDQLPVSYLEASVALQERMSGPSDLLHLFQAGTPGGFGQYPRIDQSLYIQSLKRVDQQVALRTLEEIIDEIARASSSFLYTRFLCYGLFHSALRAMEHVDLGEFAGELRSLQDFTTLDQFRQLMRRFTISVCELQESRQRHEQRALRERIVAYLQEHFASQSLSLEQTAADLGLSPAYISRFLREETGYSFIQYVTLLRINQIKAQLATTDRKIKDIILDAGYLDPASFVRKFRSIEGMTPTEYRQKTQARL